MQLHQMRKEVVHYFCSQYCRKGNECHKSSNDGYMFTSITEVSGDVFLLSGERDLIYPAVERL